MITLHLMRAMAAAGCTAQQMLAAHEHLVEQIALEAVAAALFPSAVGEACPSPVLESGFMDLKPDSLSPRSEPTAGLPAVKRAALAGLEHCGLRPAARLVAARLVEHFNLDTGRCDPAVGTLAAASGLDPRSVRRAIVELETARLVARDIHRGRNYSNAYRPNLHAMAQLSDNIGQLDSGEKPDGKTGLESAKTDSLTYLPVPAESVARARAKPPPRPRQFDPSRQHEMRLLSPVPGRAAIAEVSAIDRLRSALNAHLSRFGPRAARSAWAEIGDEIWSAAVAAETAGAGTGFPMLLEALGPKVISVVAERG